MAALIVADIISKENTTQQVYLADDQIYTMKDISMPRTFLYKNRHSSTTSEDLSEIWGLSISQDALTLKSTTHKMTRSAIMPLEQRYRADQMFEISGMHGTMSTDTMESRCQLIHNKKYC